MLKLVDIVIDIGGTSTRGALYHSDKHSHGIIKSIPSPNFISHSKKCIFPALFQTLKNFASSLSGNVQIDTVGIAFPGPISAEGRVLSAPTLFGEFSES